MIFLTEKSIRQNVKRFGFKSYDTEVLTAINNSLKKFTENKLQKALKKHKTVSRTTQRGGRVVLPSEYFGVTSGSHFEQLTNHGADMNVTEAMIRASIPTNDLSGAIKGGARVHFAISKKSLANALQEAKTSLHQEAQIRSEVSSALQKQFEELMTSLLKKTSKGAEHLSIEEFQKALSQKKFASLRG
jgi:hypothetical protein